MNQAFEKLTALDKSAYSQTISPMFSNCSNAIVFDSSGEYAPYLDVALRSLVKNSSDKNYYDIIVLTKEIDSLDCNLINSHLEDYKNISLRFYDPSAIVEPYIASSRYKYFYLNYYKLALPWILDKYEKVLNLGIDVVIKKDVAELLNCRMSDSEYIAGAIDLGYIGRLAMDISHEELNLKNPEGYINADVLIFNNKNIRRNFSMDSVLELWQRYKFRCAEQDALNVLFENHIHYLDLKWNVFPGRMNSTIHIAHNNDDNINLWKESLKNPYIVHFAAYPKPWDCPTVQFADEWWWYARKSPYYEELVRRMLISGCKSFFENKKTRFSFVQASKKVLLKVFTSESIFYKICKKLYKKIFIHKKPDKNMDY